MKDKYYTPSLDEFHVGFEYESYIEESNSWSNEIFYMNESHLSLIRFCEVDKLTRVRCLDCGDIESLGWEFDDGRWVTKDDKYIMFYFNDGAYSIKRVYSYTHRETPFCGYKQIFEGAIKNKHELKVLMKQLGI